MRLLFSSLALFILSAIHAQTRWNNPANNSYPVLQNQAWSSEIGNSFERFPARAEKTVRKLVWDLSHNTAGLAIHFYTNSPEIIVRYKVKGSFAMNHMPATGVSGVDLYAVAPDGKLKFAWGSYRFGDTVQYKYQNLVSDPKLAKGFEYRLFLPLYNSIEWMQIGVPDSCYFEFIPVRKEKPVIVYGTSIAQGGCASRPAMGWTNILSRKLNYPVVNLAFSGNGPFEKAVVDLIQEIDAKVFIFDCLPNMGSLTDDEIYKRVMEGVQAIRAKHSVPIILTDHAGHTNDQTDTTKAAAWKRLNIAQKKAYQQLLKNGTKNLYYLDHDTIAFPADGAVDNTHPNDLGMQAYADAYERLLRKVM